MMRHNIKAELTESMDSLHFSARDKERMIRQLSARQAQPKAQFSVRRAVWIAAAAVMLVGMLTGAAAFTRWSQTAQTKYNPSQEVKEQAEQSGLSVMLNDNSGEVLSVEDQDITITAVQTLVDEYGADITFRIEGFDIPEGRYPSVWPEITIDGTTNFYTYQGGDFLMDGEVFEYTHHITFQESAGKYFGKEIVVQFDSLDIQSEVPAGFPETAVDGNWELRWTFTGTEEAIHITPNMEIGDSGVTLLEAEIGQMTLRTVYQLESYWAGWETLKTFQPRLCAVRIQDGTEITCYASTEGYQDMDNLIFFVESSMDGILDLSQVESLIFHTDSGEAVYIPIA